MMNIGVVFGGKSVEHDISIITAISLINAIRQKYRVVPIYIGKDGKYYTGKNLTKLHNYASDKWRTGAHEVCFVPESRYLYKRVLGVFNKDIELDFVFLCNHGGDYEGGAVASMVKSCSIPYSSSDMTSSGNSQDKEYTKIFAEHCKVNVVPYLVIKEEECISKENIPISNLGQKIILKPSRLGSSVGIIVCDVDEFEDNISETFKYENKVIAEKYIENMQEINVSAIKCGGEIIISNMEEPIKKDEILSFTDKYITNTKSGMESMRKIVNPQMTDEVRQYIEQATKKLYNSMEFFGIVRFDYIIDKDTEIVYLNEINNIPGSLSSYLYKGKYTFLEIVESVIKEGVMRERRRKEKVTTFQSSIFNNSEYSDTKINK